MKQNGQFMTTLFTLCHEISLQTYVRHALFPVELFSKNEEDLPMASFHKNCKDCGYLENVIKDDQSPLRQTESRDNCRLDCKPKILV